MRFVISSVLTLCLLSCGASPAYAKPMNPGNPSDLRQICQEATARLSIHDNHWLQRIIKNEPKSEQYAILLACNMYVQGLRDGFSIGVGERHAMQNLRFVN